MTISFLYDDNGNWSYGAGVDDIVVEEGSFCSPPSDIALDSVSTSEAEISWEAGDDETAWEVVYGEIDFDIETEGTSIEVDEAQAEITNLGADEEYEVYVRAICSDSDYSTWSNAFTFSTNIESVIVSQDAPVENETYCYSNNDFKEWLFESENGEILNITFNAGSVEESFSGTYDDLVIYDGQNDGGDVLFDSDEDGGDLQGLSFQATSGFIYITLESDGGTSCDSGVEETIDFDVIVITCPQPQDVIVENITTSTADLTWIAAGDETEWEVLYGISGFDTETEGTSVTVDNGVPSLNLDDLETATLYDIYVRAICSDDDASLWSFATFSTRPENDDCDNAIELQLNEGLECTVVNSATNVGATASSQEDNITGTPNNDVWFSFTATEATHIISLENIVVQAGTSTDMGMAVYDATEGCDMLTLVDDSDPETMTLEDLTIGNTYLLRVYGWYSSISQTTFDICVQSISCLAPTDVEIENITATTADITWTAGGDETEWEILYGEEDFDLETGGTSVIDNDGTLGETIENLDPYTEYDVYVRALCDSESEWTSVESFTTSIAPVIVTVDNPVENETYCYGNNDFVEWLYQSENGEPLVITFNAGSLEESSSGTWDDLIIYDGDSDEGEVLFDSDEYGANLEGLSFEALSGFIYMTLDADGSTNCNNDDDIEALDFNVTIQEEMSVGNEYFSNLTYYPNPTTSDLYVKSLDQISEVNLYNIIGQKVISRTVNSSEFSVNLAELKTGAYFVEIINNNNRKVFKVLKE